MIDIIRSSWKPIKRVFVVVIKCRFDNYFAKPVGNNNFFLDLSGCNEAKPSDKTSEVLYGVSTQEIN